MTLLPTKPGSASKHTRRLRKTLSSVAVLAVLLSGGKTNAAAQSAPDPAAQLTFERYEVVTGSSKRQTVLSGFLLGGAMADLAVVHIDEYGDNRLQLFEFDGDSWQPAVEATLAPGVLFVDVANIGGRERLLTYASGRLNWFDPDSATERPLVEVPASYNATARGLSYGGAEPKGPADEGEIPHVDVTRDLNGDSLDDLVVPGVGGFRIFTQRSDGSFADPVRLGPPEPFRNETAFDDSRTYGQVGVTPLTVRWYLSRVHEMDYDHDGRNDLVFWNEDHFDVHLQDARGQFSPVPDTFTVDVPFESDGVYTLLFGFSGRSACSLIFGFGARTDRTVLHSLRDIDGDGVEDLVTLTLKGGSVLRLRTGYAVHHGVRTIDGTEFAREPSASIRPHDKAPPGYSSQWLEDFDGDGQIDVLYGGVRTGIGAMIRALLGTSITMSAKLFLLQGGTYPDRPTATRRSKSDINFGGGGRDAGFFPAILVGDVNGDGSSDVLIGKSREELHVYLGGPDLLARDPVKVTVALPGDERNSWLVDLDRDGKQDLLMHHPSTTEPHRVTMLIAR